MTSTIHWPEPKAWKERHPDLRGLCEVAVTELRSSDSPRDHSLIYVAEMTDDVLKALGACKGCLLVLNQCDQARCEPLERDHAVLYSADPRYRFAEVLRPLWDHRSLRGTLIWDQTRGIAVGTDVKIDSSVTVEAGVTIAGDCVIGPGAYIMSGARIGPRVRIGEETVIRENAVVGGYGFGIARMAGKPPIRIPHIGGVVLGRDVEIGAFTTVCSGTINPTVLEDYVKIDDHVHVAHNCHVGEGVFITACAEISGSVRIGKATWVAPGCTILNGISIGADCLLMIGAVLTKSLPDAYKAGGHTAKAFPKS